MQETLVVYGLTGNPVHKGHVQSLEWLLNQNHSVVVVPAIGHEFKPLAFKTYFQRRRMCKIFASREGSRMLPLEEHVLGFPDGTDDMEAILGALKRKGRPVMAIDVLRETWRLNYPIFSPNQIRFAIGPDINVDIWTGIEEIREEGYGFIRLPEVPDIRSTLIRANIAGKLPWQHLVPEPIQEVIREEGMYGWTSH